MTTWQETVKVFSRVTDKLGKNIDDGIFDTVVALNMLGISTIQSCEGHLDWGVPYPWVAIKPDMEQKYRLHQYLERFYAERTINFDRVLIFHGYKMRSQGAAFVPLLPSTEQVQKLKVYQAEMGDFTAFLKSILPQEDILASSLVLHTL